jgi:hypothetical protein
MATTNPLLNGASPELIEAFDKVTDGWIALLTSRYRFGSAEQEQSVLDEAEEALAGHLDAVGGSYEYQRAVFREAAVIGAMLFNSQILERHQDLQDIPEFLRKPAKFREPSRFPVPFLTGS